MSKVKIASGANMELHRVGTHERLSTLEAEKAELERQLAELTEPISDAGHTTADGLRAEMEELREKLTEARADGERRRARVGLAVEAIECCTSCVRTWLVGVLDEEQEARVREAIAAAKGEG
jgi:predicted  nucleic acid-binding Zn-ribbon protein